MQDWGTEKLNSTPAGDSAPPLRKMPAEANQKLEPTQETGFNLPFLSLGFPGVGRKSQLTPFSDVGSVSGVACLALIFVEKIEENIQFIKKSWSL